MNTVSTRRTLTQHRKIAIAFRENALLPIFESSLTTLKQCVSGSFDAQGPKEDVVRGHALGLALQCLSFDFVGIFPDDSSEDIGTVQMPLSWRGIIQDLSNLDLFFQLYQSSKVERCQQVLPDTVHVISVFLTPVSTV